jgi:hypothetical protein
MVYRELDFKPGIGRSRGLLMFFFMFHFPDGMVDGMGMAVMMMLICEM